MSYTSSSSSRHKDLDILLSKQFEKLELLHSTTNAHDATITSFEVEFIDTEEALLDVEQRLSNYNYICFDAEGVDLGRYGELTIATMQGIAGKAAAAAADEEQPDTPIYVIDVMAIGGKTAFSKSRQSGLCKILEDKSIVKITFDCRSDSDALYHQFGVSLSGSFDLQLYDQAIRIHKGGELPPQRNPYLKYGIPFVSGMRRVLEKYSCQNNDILKDKSLAPHKMNMSIWRHRPLSEICVDYAARDVHALKVLWHEMNHCGVPDYLMKKVVLHSKYYEGFFRDRKRHVDHVRDKLIIMEELPIITVEELPPNHPKKKPEAHSLSEKLWNDVVSGLNDGSTHDAYASNRNALFQNILFLLECRKSWYTPTGIQELKRLCSEYPFTSSQHQKLNQWW